MIKSERFTALFGGFCILLLFAAFATIQVLIGGMRVVYSLPPFAAVGSVGVLAIFLLRQQRPAPSSLCLALTTAFLGYVIVRASLSPFPYIARNDIYSALAGVVVYFFTACFFTDAKQRMFFLVGLLALAVVHVFIGALQFRDGTNYMPIPWLQRYDYGTRASGFYICPNHLAGLLEVVGVMGLSMVCWSRWPTWVKLLLSYGVGICYVGLILTGSRGGYLSTGTSLVVFGCLSLIVLRRASGNLFWKIGGLGVLATSLLAVVVIFLVNKSPYLTSRAQTVIDTGNMRVLLWKGALQQWKLAPIFGTGSGTYQYYARFFRDETVQLDPIYTHNDYLHLLSEYGLIAALAFSLFLVAHLRQGLQRFSRLGPKRVAVSQRIQSNALALNVGALAAVASYMVHSVVDFNLHIPANVLLLAFVFGLLANDGVLREPERSSPPSGLSFWRFAPIVLGIILLVQCIRLFPGEYFAEHARAAVRDGNSTTAIREALRGLEYDPSNPDLHYYMGVARIQLGEAMSDPKAASSFYRQGIVALEEARALAPREEIYAIELATALDSEGEFAQAEWQFYDAMRLDPKSNSLRRYYEAHLKKWRGNADSKQNPPEGGS